MERLVHQHPSDALAEVLEVSESGFAAHRHKAHRPCKRLAKVPTPDRPGQIWQSDITYLETQEGWRYLAFTLDACSRRCVAHHCREDLLTALTTTTFDQAVRRPRPLTGLDPSPRPRQPVCRHRVPGTARRQARHPQHESQGQPLR